MKPMKLTVVSALALALAGAGVGMLSGCEDQWEQEPMLEPAERPVQPADPVDHSTDPVPEPLPLIEPNPVQDESEPMTTPELEPELQDESDTNQMQ